MNDEVLDKCAKDHPKGLHLIELFNFLS
jgi:hypothetical protein